MSLTLKLFGISALIGLFAGLFTQKKKKKKKPTLSSDETSSVIFTPKPSEERDGPNGSSSEPGTQDWVRDGSG